MCKNFAEKDLYTYETVCINYMSVCINYLKDTFSVDFSNFSVNKSSSKCIDDVADKQLVIR